MQKLCPGCGVVKKMTKHHILPKRHFRVGGGQILLICRECHNELELLIPQKRVKDVMFYYHIIVKFLNSRKGDETQS